MFEFEKVFGGFHECFKGVLGGVGCSSLPGEFTNASKDFKEASACDWFHGIFSDHVRSRRTQRVSGDVQGVSVSFSK